MTLVLNILYAIKRYKLQLYDITFHVNYQYVYCLVLFLRRSRRAIPLSTIQFLLMNENTSEESKKFKNCYTNAVIVITFCNMISYLEPIGYFSFYSPEVNHLLLISSKHFKPSNPFEISKGAPNCKVTFNMRLVQI